jgi:hypothetical protein
LMLALEASISTRHTLVNLFNTPTSSLKVMLMMFNVGAVGLNLHTSCNEVACVVSQPLYCDATEGECRARAANNTLGL